jgi:hypothetical protein
MNPRIISPLEERQVKAYLWKDGEKNVNVRVLAVRVQRHLPEIKRELELLEEFLSRYKKTG